MENVVQKQEQTETLPTQNSPASMMHYALQNGMDLEKLEKMMELQRQWEAQEAKKAYVAAMAKFKADPPDISKDKHVSFQTSKGKTDYWHASLANVTKKINAALSKHGLSAAWRIEQGDNGIITVTCTITHELGHSESTSLSAGRDLTGNKNDIQAIGSTVSYLQRYTLLSLTGLSTRDQDDDGKGADKPPEYINEEQLSQIRDMINHKGVNEEQFLKYMNAESDDQILAKDFGKAMNALKNAKGGAK